MKQIFSAFLIVVLTISLVQAKTILITASTGAFGKSVSHHLASLGYDLVLTGRNTDKLSLLRNEITSLYPKCRISFIPVDFSSVDISQTMVKGALSTYRLDGIVLIGPRPEFSKNSFTPTSDEWQLNFKQTFLMPLQFLQSLIPYLTVESSIVVIAGASSKEFLKSYANANVLRLAWIGEIKNIMHEVSKNCIRVNAISPGPIFTSFHEEKIKKQALQNDISFEEQLNRNVANIPLGRYGSLADLNNLVEFLLSSKSRYINGTNILLDGGASSCY